MPLGRLVRDGTKRPSQPVLAACGPRPKGDAQEVRKKPASPSNCQPKSTRRETLLAVVEVQPRSDSMCDTTYAVR